LAAVIFKLRQRNKIIMEITSELVMKTLIPILIALVFLIILYLAQSGFIHSPNVGVSWG
jgi:uncharacterized membrane protein (DUF106 family)